MSIDAKMVKELRDATGAGIMDCKEALKKADGDIEKAKEVLKKKGLAAAEKKRDRETKEGRVGSYIHGEGKIGVLIEVNCETDFVAKNDEFKKVVKNLAMQVAASKPKVVSREELPEEEIEKEKELYKEKMKDEGKPEHILGQIVDGMMEKRYYQKVCLVDQPYIKDPDISVKEYIKSNIATIGENIQVERFQRFELGE